MATSKCPNPKCVNQTFEVVARQLSGMYVSVNLVQCAKCGVVVGVIDSTHIEDIQRSVQALEYDYLTDIEGEILEIHNTLKRIAAALRIPLPP
jgi:hypothetical protein